MERIYNVDVINLYASKSNRDIAAVPSTTEWVLSYQLKKGLVRY